MEQTERKEGKRSCVNRPGIMFYFEMAEPLEKLNYTEKGKLLEAMLLYGKEGAEPKFEGKLALAWSFLKPAIDKDAEAYLLAKLQRSYANYCRSRKVRGLPAVSFEEWVRSETDAAATPSGTGVSGESRNPTTTTNTKTNTKSISISKSNTNANADEIPKGASGKLGAAELEAIQRLLREE